MKINHNHLLIYKLINNKNFNNSENFKRNFFRQISNKYNLNNYYKSSS